MDQSLPANMVPQAENPNQPTQSTVLKTKNTFFFTKKKIFAVVLLSILFLFLPLLIMFFTLDNFKQQRLDLFRQLYLGFTSIDSIPSPLHLDNPAIVNFGATYLLEGRIVKLEPKTDGSILLRHDIKGIPPLTLRKDLTLRKKTPVGEFIKSAPEDFKENQKIQTSVAFTYSDKTLNVINISIID